ncbi:MAG TPA: ATP-dependent DNA helicase PcrA [Gemmatimonadetes bacterium]|nr:ATP-dependent DNA helicase PcrA [Gemmatimonadota bacterium]
MGRRTRFFPAHRRACSRWAHRATGHAWRRSHLPGPTSRRRPSLNRTTLNDLYLASLNPQQREAVAHFEGPILVLAGAGSGKTRVLTTRIAHLVHERGVPPERILAVTFTNKAAGEMRERVRILLNHEPAGIWMGTFHAIGARLLRRHAQLLGWTNAFTILDAQQSLRLIKKVQEVVGVDPQKWTPNTVRRHISTAKNRLLSPQRFVEAHGDNADLLTRTVARVYPVYQEALKKQNSFDFDDLLVKPIDLFKTFPEVLERYRARFSFLLVDEYQDTNHAQFSFVELIARPDDNLMVVGDDDQSIYKFRGADIRNILEFEEAFPGARTVRLEQNYRSTSAILDAANAVIVENVGRKGKTLRTDRVGGDPLTLIETLHEADEARVIVEEIRSCYQRGGDLHNYRDFAVLYRTNAQSRALEEAFRRTNTPYQIVGGVRFYERREIQDTMAYLRLISNPRDAGAFDRVVNYPRRGIGAVSLERLEAFAAQGGMSLLEAASRADESADVPPAGAHALRVFAVLIQRFSALAATTRVGPLLQELVEQLGLLGVLRDGSPEGEDRADNVKELIAGALEFDADVELEGVEEGEMDGFSELDLYLQRVALVADIDRHDPEADAATMMTLHNAKGLEFPVVFIAGLEDGLFPMSHSYDDPEEMEEERRLFYVGITRAQNKLYLTHARQRRRAGSIMYGRLSPFAGALPGRLLEQRTSELLKSDAFTTPHRGRFRERRESGFIPDEDFEISYDQDAPRLVKGERVVHATFGSGRVEEVSGFGPDVRVTVEFEGVGRKKLVARYAGLKKDFY